MLQKSNTQEKNLDTAFCGFNVYSCAILTSNMPGSFLSLSDSVSLLLLSCSNTP